MNIITICVIIKIAFCPNKIGLPPGKKAPTVLMPYEQLVRTFKQVDYARYMASRPQTLYGIADSPVSLAAWLLDHNDAEGQPAAAVASALNRTTSATGELTRDELLDNITRYWLTNTGVSASRLYWEYKGGLFNAKGVSIPVAVSVFPGEQYQAPRSWTERAYPKLIHYNKVEKGGHFAAWEQPQLFSEEIRAAFRSLRQSCPATTAERIETMTAQTEKSKTTQSEDTMKRPDEASRRRFLKASSMFGLAVAFSPGTIGEAFADSQSRTTPKEDTMTQTSAPGRSPEDAHNPCLLPISSFLGPIRRAQTSAERGGHGFGEGQAVTVERPLNRGVAEVRLDVVRVRPLSD